MVHKINERGKFTEEEASYLLKQILLAINYCHVHDICHRDIKLDNIMIAENLQIKLIDFGAACLFDPELGMSGKVGTPIYIAPEVLRDNEKYNQSSDMYSIGIVAYTLLLGFFPFPLDIEEDLLDSMIKNGLISNAPLAKLSDEARHFVKSLLRLDPAGRLSSGMALNHPFIKRNELNQKMVRCKPAIENVKNFTSYSKVKLLNIVQILIAHKC